MPLEGLSSPANKLSKVVFPDPDCPTTAMVSALETSRLTLSSIEINPSVDETALLTCLHLRIIELEMFTLRVILFISLILTAPCHAGQKTMLVLGDSLSAAYGIDAKQGWVSLLQTRLDQKYNGNVKWEVVNASVSGETTAGGLARLPGLLEKHKPVLCIIELGANNGLRGQSITLMRDQLTSMVELCEQLGTSLLLGIKLPPNYGNKYSEEFHNIFNMVANDNNIAYIPFILDGVALSNHLMQTDGLHPNEKAQAIILENIWPTLDKLLQRL